MEKEQYAPILKLPVGYDYKKLPALPDDWCDRKQAAKSRLEKKEQWKHFIASHPMMLAWKTSLETGIMLEQTVNGNVDNLLNVLST